MGSSLSLLYSSRRKFHFLVLTSAMTRNKKATVTPCPSAMPPHLFIPWFHKPSGGSGDAADHVPGAEDPGVESPCPRGFHRVQGGKTGRPGTALGCTGGDKRVLWGRTGLGMARQVRSALNFQGQDNDCSLHLFGGHRKPGLAPRDLHAPSPQLLNTQ